MILLALDPSLTACGFAIIDTASRALMGAGTHSSTGDHTARLCTLFADLTTQIGEVKPAYVVVELPSTKGRAGPAQGYAGRSAMSGPVYGLAAGTACCAVLATLGRERLWTVAADVWTQGYRSVRNDRYKRSRVDAAAYFFGVDAAAFGAKSKAADVADACLIGKWAMDRESVLREASVNHAN